MHKKFENGIGHSERKESLLGCLDSLLIGPRRSYQEGIKHIQNHQTHQKSHSLSHGSSLPQSLYIYIYLFICLFVQQWCAVSSWLLRVDLLQSNEYNGIRTWMDKLIPKFSTLKFGYYSLSQFFQYSIVFKFCEVIEWKYKI